ncbi:hypothetical protein V6768_18035 [Tistrella mobilis]
MFGASLVDRFRGLKQGVDHGGHRLQQGRVCGTLPVGHGGCDRETAARTCHRRRDLHADARQALDASKTVRAGQIGDERFARADIAGSVALAMDHPARHRYRHGKPGHLVLPDVRLAPDHGAVVAGESGQRQWPDPSFDDPGMEGLTVGNDVERAIDVSDRFAPPLNTWQ